MAKKLIRTQLTIADQLVPPIYIRAAIYLPLQPNATHDEVYDVLQTGLVKTIQQIPLLAGKIYIRSPLSRGWLPGQLELRHEKSWSPPADLRNGIPQLQRKDLSEEIGYTYQELKELGFPCNLFPDDSVMIAPFIPNMAAGVDVFKAQANFVEGGCLLGVAFYHPAADATGMTLMMQAWAAHCKAVSALDRSWQVDEISQRLQPSTWDRSLVTTVFPEDAEGRNSAQMSATAWSMIGLDEKLDRTTIEFQVIDRLIKRVLFFAFQVLPVLFDILLMLEQMDRATLWSNFISHLTPTKSILASSKKTLQSPATTSAENTTPTEHGNDRIDVSKRPKNMQSSVLYISGSQFARLKKDLTDINGPAISGNDALLALLWRCLLRARVNAKHAATHTEDDVAVLQCPVDGRGVYASNYTTNYIGNFVLMNQTSTTLLDLIDSKTALRDVALQVRQSAAKITRDSITQAVTLAREVKDYTVIDHGFDNLKGCALMISSLAGFPTEQFDLGDRYFANKGKGDKLRPLLSGSSGTHRFCVVLPFNQQGGLEIVVSLFPDELEELLLDEEFSQYATFFCN